MAHPQDLEKHVAVVYGVGPVDVGGVAKVTDYIHMKNYDAVTFVCQAGTITNTTVITFTQCTQDANAGADAKAIGSGKTVTLTATTDNNTTETITIYASELDCDNNFDWIVGTSDTAAAAMISVTALCYRARYAEATMPSAIT